MQHSTQDIFTTFNFDTDAYRDLPRMLSLTETGQSAGTYVLKHYDIQASTVTSN